MGRKRQLRIQFPLAGLGTSAKLMWKCLSGPIGATNDKAQFAPTKALRSDCGMGITVRVMPIWPKNDFGEWDPYLGPLV